MRSSSAILTPMSKPKLALILVVSFLTAVLMSLGSFFYLYQPVDSNSVATQTFVIPKGQSVTKIGQRLEEAGLIRSAFIFRFEVKRTGLGDKIQAGSFKLGSDMSLGEILQQLTTGTEDLWITLLEGWRVEQVAESLETQHLVDFDKSEFLDLAKDKEGYLFPDTYLIPREMSAQQVLSLLENTFDKKVVNDLEDEWQKSELSLEDGVILASLVEREAKGYEEKRHVAGILLNRLDIGMALQVDATLQYAKGYSSALDEWWVTPTAADRQTPSLFNTYLNPGLPPHPIANPGLDSIKAVLNPLASDDFYYIHDGQGVIHYAKTLEEHNRNVAKYLR